MRGVRRVELVIVGAVVLSAPSIVQALSGGIAPTSALLRFAGALALCWVVGAIIEGTLDAYARQARQKELAEHIERLRAARVEDAAALRRAREAATPPSLPASPGEATSFP